ncbi:MAG: FmdB family zinc ribbon protein [Spirochaetota bacterium]
MPTYDYECSKCGHSFDAFQNMSDDPLTKCPECGRNSLKRLIGGGLGVIFKGSGFYVTDSRSSGSKGGSSSKKSETATTTESKSGAGTSTESTSKKDGSGSKKTAAKVAG